MSMTENESNTQQLLTMVCAKTNISDADCGNLKQTCTSRCIDGDWGSKECAKPLKNSDGADIVVGGRTLTCQHLSLGMEPEKVAKFAAEKHADLLGTKNAEFGELISALAAQ